VTTPTPQSFAVAIDGPVGVGKSTTAKEVARRLNMTYVDTGAMYRAIALYNLRQDVDRNNEAAIAASLPHINITQNRQQILLNGEDITQGIRTQEISEYTSVIASHGAVRDKLLSIQQELGAKGEVVMDGRDIASRILPWAQVKIYLDADAKERARRRAQDLAAKGQPANIDQIYQETRIRDERDKTRAHSPLTKTPDAILIDTTNLTIEETIQKIISHVQQARR